MIVSCRLWPTYRLQPNSHRRDNMPNAYESIHVIKDAATQIAEHIENLKADGLLGPDMAVVHKLMAQQLGSATCQSAMLNLAQQEMKTASESEKARFALEQKMTQVRVLESGSEGVEINP